MIRVLLVIFVIFNLIFRLNSQDLMSYQVKSGVISYKYEGRTYGNENIYFDNYGDLFSCVKTMCLSKTNVVDTLITIIKQDTLYQIDIVEHEIFINTDTRNFNSYNIISGETLKALGFNKTGVEIIAGKNCNKFSGENGTIWVWKDFVLKSETKLMNTIITKEATEIQVNIDIPSSKFEIPNNYKIIIQ